jgi:hypothetical protein
VLEAMGGQENTWLAGPEPKAFLGKPWLDFRTEHNKITDESAHGLFYLPASPKAGYHAWRRLHHKAQKKVDLKTPSCYQVMTAKSGAWGRALWVAGGRQTWRVTKKNLIFQVLRKGGI